MRPLPLLFTLALATTLAAAEPYPLWDGHESVTDYAKRVNLAPAKTLDLGDNVKLELVLIPAGQFIMGTPEPVPVDEDRFHKQILTGQVLFAVCGVVLLFMLVFVIVQAVRNRQRPKYSLIRLLAMTIAAGGAVLSGVHWRQSKDGFQAAQVEYAAALARFQIANDYEKPAHDEMLTKPFYMGKYDITQEQYQQLVGSNPSNFKGKDSPVEHVSWDDAQAFCKKLSELTHEAVRLPTEAEREYSCRAGTVTTFYAGDAESNLVRVAWYKANSKNTTHPVGRKESNAFGLYDMHGNVWQWCQDWYAEDYYGKSPAKDPEGPGRGDARLLRGGSWYNGPMNCRSAYRGRIDPGRRYGRLGFRVVEPAFRTR